MQDLRRFSWEMLATLWRSNSIRSLFTTRLLKIRAMGRLGVKDNEQATVLIPTSLLDATHEESDGTCFGRGRARGCNLASERAKFAKNSPHSDEWRECGLSDRGRTSSRRHRGGIVPGDDELPEEPSIIVINSAKIAVPRINPRAAGCLLLLR